MIKNVFKKIFLLAFIFLNQAFAEDLEITNWFNQESKQFLEIMNNADVENHYNYEKYQKFVENNFAVKSIAFGLLNENIMNETDEITLNKYVNTLENNKIPVTIRKSRGKDIDAACGQLANKLK